MNGRRQLPVLQTENDFDQACNTGGNVTVANIGFDRAQGAKRRARRGAAKGIRQRPHLNRIANQRSRAVGFNIGNRLRINARHGLRRGHHVDLPLHARGRVVRLEIAVIVHRKAFDDGENMIARRLGVFEALERHDPPPHRLRPCR